MVINLKATDYIDPQNESHFAVHDVTVPRHTQKHTHDFFEIFLIAEGSILHVVNGQEVPLSEGALVFVRPGDVHCYQPHDTHACMLMNLAFFSKTFEALQCYLDEDARLSELLDAPLPPTVLLSLVEKQQVITQLEALNHIPFSQKAHARFKLRALLAEIFTTYFLHPVDRTASDFPTWLQMLCLGMQKPSNFIEGRSALLRLANFSPEHVGRTFKRYLGTTPSHYINDLRLDYAANLLIHTDRTALDIALGAGFGNLSHFYHLFARRWQISPGEFRKRYRKDIIL